MIFGHIKKHCFKHWLYALDKRKKHMLTYGVNEISKSKFSLMNKYKGHIKS